MRIPGSKIGTSTKSTAYPEYIYKKPASEINIINKSPRELIFYILYIHLQQHKDKELLNKLLESKLEDCIAKTQVEGMFFRAIDTLSTNLANQNIKYKDMKLKEIVEELL